VNQRYSMYASTVLSLLARDLRIFKEGFFNKFIDICIQLITMVVVFGYFLPSNGLSSDFGPFVLIGVIASFGFFDVVGKVMQMVVDMEGDKTILYTLSLPISQWLVFFYIGLSWAISSSIICALLFPLGKLLFWSSLDLSKVHIARFLLAFVLSNIFFGFFALWLSSMCRKMTSLQHIFVRVINPLYMFGGSFSTWQSAYALAPIIGYLTLLNPIVYVMEGMRAAVLGQEGYLPFWLSCGALVLFTTFFAWHAISRLKKRLDCI
jgi:ABC-2 type transport system permease protein